MIRSAKQLLIVMFLGGAVSLGFYGGRQLRHALPLHKHIRPFLLSASSSGGAIGSSDDDGQDADASPSEVFATVLDYVQRDYVEGINNESQLSHGALARMFASLDDPKTNFLEPPLRQARQEALAGHFHGIGAALTVTRTKKDDVEYRYLTVVDTMPSSPAEKAGLQPGDHITEINGHWIIAYSIAVDAGRIRASNQDDTAKQEQFKQARDKFKKGYSLIKALTLLSAGEGKPLQLTVERAGQPAPLKLDLTTALTEVHPVEFRTLANRVGYLRVRLFNAKATEEFQRALDKAQGQLKGLIVDLRDNPGGVRAAADADANGYDSALKLIARLTRGGEVAAIERKPNRREPLTVTPAKSPLEVPLAVLVDSGTANLSELVAAALRDAGRAKVIGTRTFGDAILQLFTVLRDGSGVEMATARLLTTEGADLSQGVTPDIAVTSGASGTDAALERALAALNVSA
ncbi:MAG TPA: S41 family peptidase [Chthonomonadaceae bacterium]|nr:S41 family peptidase [Chthonomonadaceae bacterium]